MSRSVSQTAVALGVGILFGLGLAISRMIDPQKVKDFLDFTAIGSGGWDPSLAIVMGTAVAVMAAFVLVARRRGAPVLAETFSQPPSSRARIDGRLVAGAAIFGVGWGVSGFCPAPIIGNIALTPAPAITFTLAMVLGYWSARALISARSGASAMLSGARLPDAA